MKWFKVGIFICLLSLIWLITQPVPIKASGSSAIINVENKTVRSGDDVDIGISVQGFDNMKLAGYDFEIGYDPTFLEVLGIKPSNDFAAPPFDITKLESGKYQAVSAQSEGASGDLTLFYLTVKVLGQVGQSDITLTVNEFSDDGTIDPSGYFLDIPRSVNNGIISIELTKPPAPDVSADDVDNEIIDINATMEYKIDDGSYVIYDAANPPDLSGAHTVLVRVAATDLNLASDPTTLYFTPNIVTSSVTVIDQTTSEITISLNPAVSGLMASNFSLMDGTVQIPITNLAELSNGASYLLSANLTAGKTYTLSITQMGYDFGQTVSVEIPIEASGTIMGKVSEPSGTSTFKDLSGVTVTIEGTTYSTVTATDGTYVLNDIPSGVSYSLKFEKNNYATSLVNNVDLIQGTASTVNKVLVLMGDVNGDGFINVSDAGAIVKYFVKSTPLNYPEAANVNKDTFINVSDAGVIVKYFVKGTPF